MPTGLGAGGPGTGFTPGGPARGAGGKHLLAPPRPFTLPAQSRPGDQGCWKELPVSFLFSSCKFAFIVETRQHSWLPVSALRNDYLAAPAQVRKLDARPNGTGGAGDLREERALTA